MHWLLVGLLVSLCALLLAAGGVARHIWLQRGRARDAMSAQTARSSEQVDLESEP
jgi:hypothetical protein